jgi:hypothetical protein
MRRPEYTRKQRLSIETLADVPLFTGRPPHEAAPRRKTVSWILTGIIELLFLSMLTFSELPALLQRPHGNSLETTIDLRGTQHTDAPVMAPIARPNAPEAAPPLVIIPPPPEFQVEKPREDAGTPDGDVLGAVGRDVACAATNFEYLNASQRARCQRVPWQAGKLPDGTIVMAPAPGGRYAPRPEYHVSGADANRRAVESVPACSNLINAPCLNIVPGAH